jgi:Bacterial Ig-like domain (group 2)
MIFRLLTVNGIFLLLTTCIGTDYVDDPVVGERIEISRSLLALMVNEEETVSAKYFDQYGIEQPAVFKWTSSVPSVATVDSNGVVKAIGAGQAMVVASTGTIVSSSVNITVVSGSDQVAKVEVTSPSGKISLAVGESHVLTVTVKNINDEVLSGRNVEWFSENSSIASVNNGVVTGVSTGLVDIHAKVEGVKSNVLNFSIGEGLSGSFTGAGGYKAIGMASLKENGGSIFLDFSSDFETSFALGTFVYMANVTNGTQVKASGLEVGQITTNGAKSFNLSAISPDIKLTDYKYVIILCKPASLTFGYAELK